MVNLSVCLPFKILHRGSLWASYHISAVTVKRLRKHLHLILVELITLFIILIVMLAINVKSLEIGSKI